MNESQIWKSLDRAHDKIRDLQYDVSTLERKNKQLKQVVRENKDRVNEYRARMDRMVTIMNAFGETKIAADLGLRIKEVKK